MMRMREETHQALHEIAAEEHASLQDVLAKAVDLYRRTRFFEQMNAAYDRLRSDPEAWAQELEEREAWDATLMDGIEAEPEDAAMSSHP
jgi:hypothetical protein